MTGPQGRGVDMPCRILAALLVSFGAASQPFIPTCRDPSYPAPPPGMPLPIDAVCPISGQPNQSAAETAQNSAKNNFCAPGPAQAITVDQMHALQAQVQTNSQINFGGACAPALEAAWADQEQGTADQDGRRLLASARRLRPDRAAGRKGDGELRDDATERARLS